MKTNNTASNTVSNTTSRLYRTIWRWHFYAGLFCIPFVLSLSVTGAIYLFKPQIEAFADRSENSLSVQVQRSTAEQQIESALATITDSSFSSYRLPPSETHAVVVTVAKHGQNFEVYVNPYTLDVLKTVESNGRLIKIVRELHGELMLGNTGSILVELAGCWAIVLLVTGLYLWWPRNAKGMAGVLYPRLKTGSRQFWRDLHAVTGIWVSLLALFLLVTGLPWALVWGSAFNEIRSIGAEPADHGWVISRSHGGHGANNSARVELSETVLENAIALNLAFPLKLSVDHQNDGSWKLSSSHQNRMLRADAWLAPESGELLSLRDFEDKEVLDKAIGIGISAHEGHLFGWLNQLLGLLVAIALITVSISGFILWRSRKPANVLGAPPLLKNPVVGRTVVVITLALAAFLPLLAISLILLLVIEKGILSRFEGTRQWLGLA
ncbi:MAG: putative iron-regulated membrane protein [Thalassolituus oleivorans]|jgi:uncharacterized iron-regulated membrane protein